MKHAVFSAADIYRDAKTMPAVAMTTAPDVGKVADALCMIDVPVPRPAKDEVAIKLVASAMHVDEIFAAQGTALGRFFGPKEVSEAKPYVMGSSVSGEVVAVGAFVSDIKVGDAVITIPNEMGETRSWATYRCVKRAYVMPKPVELEHVQAAALTMASCVAWGAIGYGRVQRGERCLVVGASGAIGIIMVQMLKSMGAHVTGVCSGRNADLVRSFGADAVIDYTSESFGDAGQGAFSKVFDTVGGTEIEQNAYRVLDRTGRFITIVGPVRHVGETKLSWPKVIGSIAHIAWRYATSRIVGPRYIFGEKLPRKTIRPAVAHVVLHGIRMPIEMSVPFELDPIQNAVRRLSSHRTRGRIVIDFQRLPTAGRAAQFVSSDPK